MLNFVQNRVLLGMGACTCMLGYTKYHLATKLYREKHEALDRNKNAVPLDDDMHQMTEEVIDCLLPTWDPWYMSSLNFFVCKDLDPNQKGMAGVLKGMPLVIGLPYYYRFKSTEDPVLHKYAARISGMALQDDSNNSEEVKIPEKDLVSWESLLDSLVLSRNAKLFAIAREMWFTNSKYFSICGGIVVSTVFLLPVLLSDVMNIIFLLRGWAPFWLRTILHIPCFGVGFICCFTLLEIFCVYEEERSDRKACEMGSHFAEGALELYDKTLQRNRALRQLLGKAAESKYTAEGNDIISKYMRPFCMYMSLTERRDYVIDVCTKIAEEKKKSEEENDEKPISDYSSNSKISIAQK